MPANCCNWPSAGARRAGWIGNRRIPPKAGRDDFHVVPIIVWEKSGTTWKSSLPALGGGRGVLRRTNKRLTHLTQRQSFRLLLQSSLQAVDWLLHRLVAQPEGLVMHRNNVLCP